MPADRAADDGHTRATIALIGDSNMEFALSSLAFAIKGDPTDTFIDVARTGAAIRFPTANFWQVRIHELGRAAPDGYVVNLGINDAFLPGDTHREGYKGYGAKIDWLLGLLPRSKPMWWTNLPCSIEPAKWQQGCAAVNRALAAAPGRWSNLRLLDWATVARGHHEFLRRDLGGIHLSSEGARAWAALVAGALDRRFRR